MNNPHDGQNSSPLENGRPSKMEMTFQRGMLKTLGINLYANIGKVLVEFIANAYDSDATIIEIDLPIDDIREARQTIKRDIKEATAKVLQDAAQYGEEELKPAIISFDGLTSTLPETIKVTIKDDGHGMTWTEVKDKFLPLNRQRRLDQQGKETHLTSPNGRFVMGRKGVGKLAGFGAAEKVVLRTKRKGETYATVIVMSDTTLEGDHDGANISVPVTYEDGLSSDEQGTTVTLSVLKADAFKSSINSIADTITSAFFAIKPEDFRIELNNELLVAAVPDYEFVYPENLKPADVKAGMMADSSFEVADVGVIPFRYYIGFRKRTEHLPASKRGARVYCNNRLAAGPTLFSLGTGMHSFHSVDYLECIVEADELDRGSVDLITTSRTQFQEGNDVYDKLQATITELMRASIGRHAVFREKAAMAEINEDPAASYIRRAVEVLSPRQRDATTKLLTTFGAQYGVGTPEFLEVAPVILNSVNATDVLVRLISVGTKPETITSLMSQLRDLAEIEKQDALKLYRGRRGGISKLQALQDKGEELWKKKGFENELHQLLKDNPWLIRPEFSNYTTSNQTLNTIASKIAKHLGVDNFAPIIDGDKPDDRRPDLVFAMTDQGAEGPHVIKIVEFKSPSIPLSIEHYRQLENYIGVVDLWYVSEFGRKIAIQGFLIGEMPPADTQNQDERLLLRELGRSNPESQIKILGLTQMINDARNVHLEVIETLERQLSDDEEISQAANDEPSSDADSAA